VAGSKDSIANEFFYKRLDKSCDAIIIAIGYRLVLENKFASTFDDGFKVVQWLVKHASHVKCNNSLLHVPKGYFRNDSNVYREYYHRKIMDSLGYSLVETWLAAHENSSMFLTLY